MDVARFALAAGAAAGSVIFPLVAVAAATVTHQDVTVQAADGRAVPVRVFAAASGCRHCALVIFSHGSYSNYHDYDALLDDWAAHGLVIAAPLHVDSKEYPEAGRYSMVESRALRVADYAAVDAALRPNGLVHLKGISFSGKTFAAGHSYGAAIAEIAGGAKLDPDAEAKLTRSWRIPQAVVALSPPPALDGFLSDAGWASIKRPSLVVSGTADMLKGYFASYHVHMTAYSKGPPSLSYSLVFDGMDHSFNGGYWQVSSIGGAQSVRAVQELNTDVLKFFDAFLNGRPPHNFNWKNRTEFGVVADAK